MSYVKAARELPLLTPKEIEEYALKYGLIETAAHVRNNPATGVLAGGDEKDDVHTSGSGEKSEEKLE